MKKIVCALVALSLYSGSAVAGDGGESGRPLSHYAAGRGLRMRRGMGAAVWVQPGLGCCGRRRSYAEIDGGQEAERPSRCSNPVKLVAVGCCALATLACTAIGMAMHEASSEAGA